MIGCPVTVIAARRWSRCPGARVRGWGRAEGAEAPPEGARVRGWTGRRVCEHQVTAVGHWCRVEVRGAPKSGRRFLPRRSVFRPQYYPDFGT